MQDCTNPPLPYMDEFKVLAGKEAEGALPFKKQSPGA